jgi:hypothetical protein
MFNTSNKRVRIALACSGLLPLLLGAFLAHWSDGQVSAYNEGLEAYKLAQTADSADPNNPVRTYEDRVKMIALSAQLFDKSLEVYQEEQAMAWLPRVFLPHADVHLAAKAAFREAISLTWLQKNKEAVAAYELSLKLNPGGAEDKFGEDTYPVQHNLYLLLAHDPSLQNSQGNGEGNGNSARQRQPGGQAGHQPLTRM